MVNRDDSLDALQLRKKMVCNRDVCFVTKASRLLHFYLPGLNTTFTPRTHRCTRFYCRP
jgi:hypothetical protein